MYENWHPFESAGKREEIRKNERKKPTNPKSAACKKIK